MCVKLHAAAALQGVPRSTASANMLLGIAQVIMMFAQPFWPAAFFDVVCTDSFIPEFWVTTPMLTPPLTPCQPQPASMHTGLQEVDKSQHAQQQSAEPPVHCMVGFVAGSKAEEVSKLRQNSVIIKTLSQLDQMFGKPQLAAEQEVLGLVRLTIVYTYW